MRKIKILVPIVNRTNYSKLRAILILLNKQDKVDVSVIPSSGIVVTKIGNALKDISRDGIRILEQVDCLLANDTLEAMGKTAGISLLEHSSIFSRLDPDLLLVVGDRFDVISPVLAAKILNIPIAHIQGGETSGSIDNYIRDIVTICSDYHYVSTQKSYDNVMSVAHSKKVLNVGCPAVEMIQNMEVGFHLDVSKFSKKYKQGFNIKPHEPYLLVAVHPNTEKENEIDMNNILNACMNFDIKTIVLYPNIDAFNHHILDCIRNFSSLICVKHMPLSDFVPVMAHASCMIGNSSAGIREAASFGTPVVNIGSRQQGRERNVNTIDCECNLNVIINLIKKSLKIKKYPYSNIYYKENSSKNVVEDILDNQC